MKTLPFDLEKAKLGHPFTRTFMSDAGIFTGVRRFIGTTTDGKIIYEQDRPTNVAHRYQVNTVDPEGLVMLVETKTIRVRLVKNTSTGGVFPASEGMVFSDRYVTVKDWFEVEYDDVV